jgi:hypothetical protein
VIKWGAITFGIGMALVLLEVYVASKKKEGIQAPDKQRIYGIVWTVLVLTALVMGLVWMSS